jgi:hypothetical protein
MKTNFYLTLLLLLLLGSKSFAGPLCIYFNTTVLCSGGEICVEMVVPPTCNFTPCTGSTSMCCLTPTLGTNQTTCFDGTGGCPTVNWPPTLSTLCNACVYYNIKITSACTGHPTDTYKLRWNDAGTSWQIDWESGNRVNVGGVLHPDLELNFCGCGTGVDFVIDVIRPDLTDDQGYHPAL